MVPESFSDIQRQFTHYLRNPSCAPLPTGTDLREMRFYARSYRRKLRHLLETRWPTLAETLGRDMLSSLIDDYVRLPRESVGGKSTLEEAFVQYLEEESPRRGLPPFMPELANFSMVATLVTGSPREIEDDDLDRDGDLLGRVPVFSPLAELLTYEWPVHRIGADFLPKTKPAQATRLIVYRDRRGHGGWIELNQWAAEIALQVKDNVIAKTGAEILVDSRNNNPLLDRHSLMREGAVILKALQRRDIIIGVREETPTSHSRRSDRSNEFAKAPC